MANYSAHLVQLFIVLNQINLPQHCIILELLSAHLTPGEKVLEIGTGTGYLTTLFGALVGGSGKVYTVEHIPELLEAARKRVKAKADNYVKRINFYGTNK